MTTFRSEAMTTHAGRIKEAVSDLMAELYHIGLLESDRAERIGELLNDVLVLKSLAREAEHVWKEASLEWCRENGDLDLGTSRYYAGTASKVRQLVPAPQAMDILFEAVGGDTEEFSKMLSKGAFKQGAAKTLAGSEAWSKVWTKDPVLDEDGEPVPELKKAMVLT